MIPYLLKMRFFVALPAVIFYERIRLFGMSVAVAKIREHISLNSSISFSEFIRLAMYSEHSGYYMNRNPIGKHADFITAPEITSLFGKVIGIWVLQQLDSSSSGNVSIVELGPGTGLMMLDVLSALERVLNRNFTVYMVEISPFLREVQRQNLRKYSEKIFWLSELSEVPETSSQVIVANEFFDALPVDQFVFRGNRFYENRVAVNSSTHALEIISVPSDFCCGTDFVEGDVVEIPVEGKVAATEILRRTNNGGSALVIDYGYKSSPKRSTIQSVKAHKFSSVLENIGNSDITHEVDFSLLFPGAALITQREFLTQYGIYEIAARSSAVNKSSVALAIDRLINVSQMGDLFKCLLL